VHNKSPLVNYTIEEKAEQEKLQHFTKIHLFGHIVCNLTQLIFQISIEKSKLFC